MSEAEQRAQFEAWCIMRTERDATGEYASMPVRLAWAAWQAALALQAQAQVPDGYVLVPREPTEAMIDAIESIKMPHAILRTGVRLADFRERYAAMLAAAPAPGVDRG